MNSQWTTTSPQETRDVAVELLPRIQEEGLLLLKGDLGAGKTCFVQGLAEAMGIDDPVTSPTYGLIKEYGDPPRLVHADLYRLTHAEEYWEIGLEEWREQPGVVCVVEWPERVPDVWSASTLCLTLEQDAKQESVRQLTLSTGDPS